MQFIKVESQDFDSVYPLIKESFPVYERRNYSEAKEVLNEKDYTLFKIEEGGEYIGLISVWDLDKMFFIEHFAICPSFRNKGLGSKVLQFAISKWKNIVLEAEPSTTPMAKRRLGFYARNGFCQNPFKYMQPAYREGEKDVELILLSCPTLLSDGKETVTKIYKKVYGR